MKSIDVELGKSNMLPLIASQQFYASWKVFIRELLLNAMDACNVRQALEWSWGTEFLEMEQASQMRDVRAIYEPRIDITYSSDTRLFTIEDNGIGINEYDLEHFIAQIGASYYTSTDFFNQQLKYEPYSHYGIGLCSCFTVSKAVLIESKKDKVINTAWNISNPQDTAPVMAKWFGESGQIEYVISQKKTPGTRISIPVKPSYAPYIDLDFIVETIKHYWMAPCFGWDIKNYQQTLLLHLGSSTKMASSFVWLPEDATQVCLILMELILMSCSPLTAHSSPKAMISSSKILLMSTTNIR